MTFQSGWKYFPFKDIALFPKVFSPTFGGIRVIQLSDLHLRESIKLKYLELLVKKINLQKPDIVVFTGDIIQVSPKKLHKHIDVFRKIQSPSYYVSGNHDMVYGPKYLKELMQKNAITCIDDLVVKLDINGVTIQLVGIGDRYSFIRGIKRNIKDTFDKLDRSLPTILLAHQPKDILHVKDYRIDIQLSGHTHGGQVYPFSILVKLFQSYFKGIYMHNKTLLYVTSGLGYWGIDIRYKAPSEIAIITIY